MTDLNSLLDAPAVSAGWELISASDINAQGWIVGYARKAGQTAGVVLIPIPEPEIYVMFIAGLGLMGFMARRCKTT